jgi:phospholipase/carboxylesterase
MANLVNHRYGQLNTHLITAEPQPELAVIFCHGFGAPSDDLVSVGAQLLRQFPALLDTVEMIFPEAPISLESFGFPQGRAWWPLDLERLSAMSGERDFEQMSHEVPSELPTSRELLIELIDAVRRRHNLSMKQIVVGGFSQGAMLATDVALHLETPPGGLVIWSGALISKDDWNQCAPRLKGVPIFQSHGRHDPILNFKTGTWVRNLLLDHGANLNFFGFDGEHTIPMEAITATGELLTSLLIPPTASLH